MINKILKEFENEFMAKDGGWKGGIPPKEILRFITTSLTSLHKELINECVEIVRGTPVGLFDSTPYLEDTVNKLKRLSQ